MQSPWLSPRIQNSTHQNPHGWQTPPADTPLGHGKATEKEEKRAVAGGRLSVGFRESLSLKEGSFLNSITGMSQ